MATKTRNPTSEVAVTGTWSGTNRHLLLDDYPDSGNPIADGTTCSAAGVLVMGFSAFDVPAGSTGISVQVLYYDFKNGSSGSVIGSLIRCNDTTNRLSGTHNPGNGNANIAQRTDNWATNPKSGAAWTVDDVNGVGTNGLTALGLNVTDASPTVTVSSVIVQVTYTPPCTGTLSTTLGNATESAGEGDIPVAGASSKTLGTATASGTATISTTVLGTGTPALAAAALSGVGNVVRTGTFAHSLAAMTSSGEADVAVAGTESRTLAAATVSATSTVSSGPVGVLSLSLGALAASGGATVPLVGTGAPALGALTLGGNVALDPEGVLAKTLATLALSGAGTVGTGVVTGTLNVTLGGAGPAGQQVYMGRAGKYFRVTLP